MSRSEMENNMTILGLDVDGLGVSLAELASVRCGLRDVQFICHELAVNGGWWTDLNPNDPYVFATQLALVHSEISEGLEGGRKGKMDDHLPHRKAEEVELADALIRIFDLAQARNLDLSGALIEKLAYNKRRADHKPEARAAAGGKKF